MSFPGAFDLHTHSRWSDGKLRPAALVRLIADRGIGIALTDHDWVGGVSEALRVGRRFGVTVIPGIELSAAYRERAVHVLGLFIDHGSRALVRRLAEIRRGRRERARVMLERLARLGYRVSWRDFTRWPWHGPSISGYIVQELIDRGVIAASEREAFSARYLVPGGPVHVPRVRVSLEEAVALIGGAGGVPVLAHPGCFPRGIETGALLAFGMQGIEAHYPAHSAEDTARFERLAQERGIVVTGGSDFHAHGTPDEPALGAYTTPLELVLQLAHRATSRAATEFVRLAADSRQS